MKQVLFILLSIWSISAYAQFNNVQVGDIIDINGIKGLVYQVDETGCHGTAMSLQCLRGVNDSWCNDRKLVKELPAIINQTDGKANTDIIVNYAKENNALDKFPIFKWCTNMGEGWYIPSLKELEAFVNYWLGNEQTIDWDMEEDIENVIDDSKPFYKQVNAKILEAGGIPFLSGVFTSTMNEDKQVYVFMFNKQKNSWSFRKTKTSSNFNKYFTGRAFYKF